MRPLHKEDPVLKRVLLFTALKIAILYGFFWAMRKHYGTPTSPPM